MSADLYDSAIVVSILAATLRTMTPLLFSAMGELVTQRAGIWNMSVEGAMLSGAFAAYIVIATTGSPVLALLAAILAGMMVSLLNAILTASLKVDHFVAGLALNLLAAGLTLFWFRAFISGRGQPTFDGLAPPDWALADLPVLGPILFAQRPLTWLAFLCVPLVWFLLYRTRQGLELRCLGENPAVLDFKGVNVVARQYAASLFGGAMTGLGGGFLILAFSDRFLPDITAGRGWLVVVAIIAGGWRPLGVLAAVTVFAFLEALAIHAQVLGLGLPHQLFLAAPYIASLLLLTHLRHRDRQPALLGEVYRRGER